MLYIFDEMKKDKLLATHFAANIKLLRKRRNLTQDELSSALDMKRSTLSGYENEIAQPGLDILIRFSTFFNISVDTLLKVDLSLLSQMQLNELENGYDTYITGSQLRILAITTDKNNEENIELVTEKAKAGYRSGYSDPEYIRSLPVFQLPFLSREKKYRTFQISGDSMLPIPEGAYVTGEFIENWSFLKEGDACIILTQNDGILFKLLGNRIASRKPLRLISLNSFYEPFTIEIKEIREIWKFINYINPYLPDPETTQDELNKTVAALKKDVEIIKGKLE